MTREEAAKMLDILKVFDAPDLSEAIRMAKAALREQDNRIESDTVKKRMDQREGLSTRI